MEGKKRRRNKKSRRRLRTGQRKLTGDRGAQPAFLRVLHSSTKVRDCPVGVRKPQQAKDADNQYLADNGKTVDQEGANSTAECRFDQIKHVHNHISRSRVCREQTLHLPPARHRGSYHRLQEHC